MSYHAELIDTLWNVNFKHKRKMIRAKTELIDTLWNVNKGRTIEIFGGESELIDTLWNVNPPPGKKLKHVCQN